MRTEEIKFALQLAHPRCKAQQSRMYPSEANLEIGRNTALQRLIHRLYVTSRYYINEFVPSRNRHRLFVFHFLSLSSGCWLDADCAFFTACWRSWCFQNVRYIFIYSKQIIFFLCFSFKLFFLSLHKSHSKQIICRSTRTRLSCVHFFRP